MHSSSACAAARPNPPTALCLIRSWCKPREFLAHTPTSASILVVDDEPDLRTLYELTLLREGYRVETAGSVQDAAQLLLSRRFDVMISDMRLPDGTGMELLLQLREQARPERCIVMTAYGSAENAVDALRAGAFDYLTKPVDLRQFRQVVASAIQGIGAVPTPGVAPSMAVDAANSRPLQGHAALKALVGESPAMQGVKQRIAKVAKGMAPVLVHGESGTGKELVARALHACSQRADGPLVAVNCGAIPENLLEAEFFGARKGSYTGATQDRPGYFQAAQGGTLFLDEIGDLPLAMQAKLLRAIQERKIRSLGSTQEEAVDVRIVSATHRDLAAQVQAGQFRQDLFYRLNVIEIALPALRERRGDLPDLCRALLAKLAHESGLHTPSSTRPAWPRLPSWSCRAMCASWKMCCIAPLPWVTKGRCACRRPWSRARQHSPTSPRHPRLRQNHRKPQRPTHRPSCPRTCRPGSMKRAQHSGAGPARQRLQPHRHRHPPGHQPAPDSLPH